MNRHTISFSFPVVTRSNVRYTCTAGKRLKSKKMQIRPFLKRMAMGTRRRHTPCRLRKVAFFLLLDPIPWTTMGHWAITSQPHDTVPTTWQPARNSTHQKKKTPPRLFDGVSATRCGGRPQHTKVKHRECQKHIDVKRHANLPCRIPSLQIGAELTRSIHLRRDGTLCLMILQSFRYVSINVEYD